MTTVCSGPVVETGDGRRVELGGGGGGGGGGQKGSQEQSRTGGGSEPVWPSGKALGW